MVMLVNRYNPTKIDSFLPHGKLTLLECRFLKPDFRILALKMGKMLKPGVWGMNGR